MHLHYRMAPARTTFLVATVAFACAAPDGESATATTLLPSAIPGHVEGRCTFGVEPTVVKRDRNTVLQFWTVPDTVVLPVTVLPSDSMFVEYRRTIEGLGADLQRPVADDPDPTSEAERLIWEREAHNVEVAFGGRGGSIRPIQCLDALLFAYQNSRYRQLSQPTEFLASVLRRTANGHNVLKIYFTASDAMFPPRAYYGLDEVEADLADGWEYWVALHNHTIQQNGGTPALGVPAPSTSDVDLLNSLAKTMGLQEAWITNGFFTIEIPTETLGAYSGRPEPR